MGIKRLAARFGCKFTIATMVEPIFGCVTLKRAPQHVSLRQNFATLADSGRYAASHSQQLQTHPPLSTPPDKHACACMTIASSLVHTQSVVCCAPGHAAHVNMAQGVCRQKQGRITGGIQPEKSMHMSCIFAPLFLDAASRLSNTRTRRVSDAA